MRSTFFRKAEGVAASVIFGGSCALFSQTAPPPSQGSRSFQLQIQPGSGPVVIGPGGVVTVPDANAVEPAASAGFEPAAGRVGRPVEYRVSITGGGRALDLPDPLPAPPGLEVSAGGRSLSTQVLNGALVMISTSRYTVVAGRAGEFTMPSFEVLVGAKRVRVPAAVFTAAEAAPGEAAYQPVRVELDLPQRDFFVGETIGGRLVVIETPDESPQYVAHVAKTTGSAVFRPSMRTRREQFTREGRQMNGLVMPVQVTPILEGEMELGCQVLVHVQKPDPTGLRSGFSVQNTLDAKPAKIRVLALPRVGRLPGFTGGIGQFAISQPKLSATAVEAGEPITLTVTVGGEGNLEGVSPPEIEASGGWQSYKPTTEYQADANDEYTARGTKTFTYTLVPGRAGQRSTPPIPFSYFDPVKRAFVDVTVPPIPIVVKPSSAVAPEPQSAKPEAPVAPELPRAAELAMTGLEEQPGRWSRSPGPAFDLRRFLFLQAGPPLALLALWAWRRRKEYLAANPQIVRRRLARAAVRRALAAARAAARKGDRKGFLQAGVGALREAAAPLDTAQAGSLTREEVLRLLRDDESVSALARRILEPADAAIYSTREAGEIEPATLLPELERAVRTLTRRA